MSDHIFLRAADVAKLLDVSVSMGYRLIRQFNDELKSRGFMTVRGRVPRQYVLDRTGAEVRAGIEKRAASARV